MARSFRTPKDNAPTRHLFIANCGVSAGLSESNVEKLFTALKAVSIQEEKRSVVFATFKDATAACEAAAQLRSEQIEGQYQKKFVVKYAELNEVSPKQGQVVYLETHECGVPGLRLLLEFVTPEEEQALLNAVDEGEWETLASRRVQHYGYKFVYKTRSVSDPMQPFPSATAPVLERLQQLSDLPHLDQLTVNEYYPGVGLAPHIDTHSAFTGAIASLSLSGGCIMEMRKDGEHRAIYLPARSLLIMAGASRYEWLHYIPHRKSDVVQGAAIPRQRRVSFTFRKIRGFPCDCNFPKDCDSQDSVLPPTRLQQLEAEQQQAAERAQGQLGVERPRQQGLEHAAAPGTPATTGSVYEGGEAERDSLGGEHPGEVDSGMESRHVHAVYEVIASHFSATRFAVWPKVREFLNSLPERGVLADVGCGNGKYFAVRPDLVVLASDRSSGLAAQAAKLCRVPGLGPSGGAAVGHPPAATGEAGVATAQLADVVIADGMSLPYKDGCADGVMSIAVLHHISSRARRLRFLGELARLLQPGGLGLVTVWASEQEDIKKLAKWERISAPKPGVVPGASGDSTSEAQPSGEGGDYFVPWHVPFHRADAVSAIRSASNSQSGTTAGPGEPQASRGTPQGSAVAEGRIDRGTSSVVFKRYYHLFDRGELDELVTAVPGVDLVSSFYDKSNWCCIFKRSTEV